MIMLSNANATETTNDRNTSDKTTETTNNKTTVTLFLRAPLVAISAQKISFYLHTLNFGSEMA